MAVSKKQKGIGLIELLIVIAIITTGLVYLLAMFSFSLRISGEQKNISQANLISQEIMEGVRNFRDNTNWQVGGLGSLTVSATYHLAKTGSPLRWTLVSGEETTDGFTQKVIFDEVRRDINDNIVESGGRVDPDSKKITVTVSWQERGKSQKIELVSYLTNWKQ